MERFAAVLRSSERELPPRRLEVLGRIDIGQREGVRERYANRLVGVALQERLAALRATEASSAKQRRGTAPDCAERRRCGRHHDAFAAGLMN